MSAKLQTTMTTEGVRVVPITLPDSSRVLAAQSQPEQGPRILFFSGGTSLGPTSRALVSYTTNSIHLVTPFDSGGSSAELRRYFSMPAVGDLRNRLTALAGCALQPGCAAVRDLLAYRLPAQASWEELNSELWSLATGQHSLSQGLLESTNLIINSFLQYFIKISGRDFNLAGASIGNLILAAGYLQNERDLDLVTLAYAQLVRAQGVVRLIIDSDLHLCATLANGQQIIGQHLFTGKETAPLTQRVSALCLVDPAQNHEPVRPQIDAQCQRLIGSADLICYPMGSFYSSIIANLLPQGVGQAIAWASCPKVFVPNTFFDPESVGLSLADQVQTLLNYLHLDHAQGADISRLLNFVLIDPQANYPGLSQVLDFCPAGVQVIQTSLIDTQTQSIDPHLLSQALVSLAGLCSSS